MNKTSKKIIKLYLKNVSKEVISSYTIKRFLLIDLRQRIVDFYENTSDINLDMINNQFGTPREIAASFNEIGMDKYIKQSKNFKLFLLLLTVIVILLLIILFMILNEYGNNIIIRD